MAVRLYPYKAGSKSATALAKALGIKRIKAEGSKFNGGGTVINWGAGRLPQWAKDTVVLNTPDNVKRAANKLKLFKLVEQKAGEYYPDDINILSIPPFCTSRELAEKWLADGAVVCRTKLSASSGEGIVLAENKEEMVDAPLYTKYIPKKDEYRVHCFHGPAGSVVLDVARKARRKDHEDPNWKVRVHDNGFVYAREGVEPPQAVLATALKIFRISELDFGAVDVIYQKRSDKAYALEINTAPGLEGQTVDTYKKGVQMLLDALA